MPHNHKDHAYDHPNRKNLSHRFAEYIKERRDQKTQADNHLADSHHTHSIETDFSGKRFTVEPVKDFRFMLQQAHSRVQKYNRKQPHHFLLHTDLIQMIIIELQKHKQAHCHCTDRLCDNPPYIRRFLFSAYCFFLLSVLYTPVMIPQCIFIVNLIFIEKRRQYAIIIRLKSGGNIFTF